MSKQGRSQEHWALAAESLVNPVLSSRKDGTFPEKTKITTEKLLEKAKVFKLDAERASCEA